ncbi:MAG: DUF2510 domain-containing protein [Coriobacteriales bacterium]|nr:DUF2510 domain-containing protein [Coriobacteriales bacterium]
MIDSQVPAGWYPEPTGDTSQIRYWDGQAWTERTRVRVHLVPQSDAPVSAADSALAADSGADLEAAVGVDSEADSDPPSVSAPDSDSPPDSDTPAPVAAADSHPSELPTLEPIYAPGQEIPAYLDSKQQQKDRKGMATGALILGIIGIPGCLFWIGGIFGVLAIIFGIRGLKSSRRGMAIAGIVCGVVAVLLMLFSLVVYLVIYPDILQNPTEYGLPADFSESTFEAF